MDTLYPDLEKGITMEMSRIWAMPNHNTFDIKPIFNFVKKYLENSKCSIDPFARDSRLADFRNDLNPNTLAESHLLAIDFLKEIKIMNIKPDLVIFDPPYSIGQIKQCYEDFGLKFGQHEAQYLPSWKEERDIIEEIVDDNAVVLSFGWNTNCMGKARGFYIAEIMLVAHGGPHNDTICVAERNKERIWAICKYCDKMILQPTTYCPHCSKDIDRQYAA